ncbi:hypothetical protein D1BOALGB6SA_5071 [Olavius sp. associated proteobacterium Delta 1]|nr:hypothetical protein D1BOALGB6SA_5071 [Olavius sp. associated proteobacterium Delta 1]
MFFCLLNFRPGCKTRPPRVAASSYSWKKDLASHAGGQAVHTKKAHAIP